MNSDYLNIIQIDSNYLNIQEVSQLLFIIFYFLLNGC